MINLLGKVKFVKFGDNLGIVTSLVTKGGIRLIWINVSIIGNILALWDVC